MRVTETLETDSIYSEWNAAAASAPPQSWQRFTFNIDAKVVPHFVQNEVYVFFCWYRMGSNIGGAVCGPCDSHLLPRQEENHSAVAGGRVKQTHVVRAEIKKGHG